MMFKYIIKSPMAKLFYAVNFDKIYSSYKGNRCNYKTVLFHDNERFTTKTIEIKIIYRKQRDANETLVFLNN